MTDIDGFDATTLGRPVSRGESGDIYSCGLSHFVKTKVLQPHTSDPSQSRPRMQD